MSVSRTIIGLERVNHASHTGSGNKFSNFKLLCCKHMVISLLQCRHNSFELYHLSGESGTSNMLNFTHYDTG